MTPGSKDTFHQADSVIPYKHIVVVIISVKSITPISSHKCYIYINVFYSPVARKRRSKSYEPDFDPKSTQRSQKVNEVGDPSQVS